MENFKNIAQKYTIQIPIIQRDYAQGRIEKKVKQIRTTFLNSIYEILKDNKNLHLDFIYGSIKNNKFIPLDGQQRLTTLFLLYWYFGKKENKEIDFLKNFSYETRASSREFCKRIVENDIDLKEEKLSEVIKDMPWFLAYWENDPTIKAMLVMLDDIHKIFKNDSFFDRLDKITFEFFKLEKFGLDDDLYIKMNARGKELTDFENFKAKFEQHIKNIDKNLQNEFSQKIDNSWTDSLWKYAVNDWSYLIDDFFLNYIRYISEMLYYKNNDKQIDDITDFSIIKEIYSSKENIKFLFKSLDNLPLLINKLPEIFSKNDYEENKVCLFSNEINLLDNIISNETVNIQEKLLLFIIIKHFNDNLEINQYLLDLLRIVRNLTNRIRHLKQSKIRYTNDLSYIHLPFLIRTFIQLINKNPYKYIANNDLNISNTGITQSSLENEKEKAEIIVQNEEIKKEIFKLEDYKYLKGDIRNFISNDKKMLNDFNNYIREIYSEEDSLIIRSMLTIDDYSIKIGWSYLGNKWYFGKNGNWEIILTQEDKKEYFEDFLNKYKVNKNLQDIIKDYLKTNKEKDWYYYFIKYPEFTQTYLHEYLTKDNNIFAWNNSYELEKMGGESLNAYHINPYIYTIGKKLEYVESYSVQSDERSYIKFQESTILIEDEKWLIKGMKETVFEELSNKFNLIKEGNKKYLEIKNNQDFIKELIKLLEYLEKE